LFKGVTTTITRPALFAGCTSARVPGTRIRDCVRNRCVTRNKRVTDSAQTVRKQNCNRQCAIAEAR
jgi:hypothetical protein